MTTVSVFFPIVFVEGVAGQIFGDMSMTVVFSLLASLAVALFLIPMLSSRQTSNFISGAQIKEFAGQSIYLYGTQEKIEKLLLDRGSEQTWIQKLIQGAQLLIQTIWQFLLKIWIIFLAVLIMLVKFLTLPLIVPFMPIFALLTRVGLIKFRISEVVEKYAGSADFWLAKHIRDIWPKYLVNNSLPAFLADLRKMIKKFSGISWLRIVVRFLLTPVIFIFYVIKYIFHIFSP